jgi:CRISPR-associated endonuclease Csn1
MGKWRLGLDLGTNSIGWAVIALDSDLKPKEVIKHGPRIFSDGRDPKSGEPLAAERRLARGIRKNIRRRKQRRKTLFRLLQNENLFPKTKKEAGWVSDPKGTNRPSLTNGKAETACGGLKAINPYEMRVKALDEKLAPFELGRALFHLGVRRGFKSNRKDAPEEKPTADGNEDIAEIKDKAPDKIKQGEKILLFQDELRQSNTRTLGEYLLKIGLGIDKKTRFTADGSIFYPTRKMYEDEFSAIRNKQEVFYPALNWEGIYNAIFFQRPLKAQERGKCQFMMDKERTFKMMPCSQEVRILQEVYNLNAYNRDAVEELSDEQRALLIKTLNGKEKMTFDAIRKLLKIDCHFNLESPSRNELLGNGIAVKMRRGNNFGALWDTLDLTTQDDIVEVLITANEDEEIIPVLAKFNLSDEQVKNILRIPLSSGTTALCREITEQLVSAMKQENLRYDEAMDKLGFKHYDQSVDKYDLLPYYGKVLTGSTMGVGKLLPNGKVAGEDHPENKYGKIANPTVHIALNQTRVVVNALIKKYDKPEQVVIELSRELKASRDDKQKMLKKQNDGVKRNAIINDTLSNSFKISYPNRNDRLKYRLWEELGNESASRRCLYCGKVISAAELFHDNIEIEHILPYSRTLLDSETNLTVAHKSCNAYKKERSPYEAFHTNPAGYNWHEIIERVACLKNPIKKNRFLSKAMETFEKESSFITRQLTDNQYLSRAAFRYLKAVCDNVWVVNGVMTKLLRDKWNIDSILKRKITDTEAAHFNLKEQDIGNYKKNRFDHRHHALDAVVIASIDRSLVQEIARKNALSQSDRILPPDFPFDRHDLITKTKEIVVSFKPDHGVEGKLSKETYLGKIKLAESILTKDFTENDIENIVHKRMHEDIKLILSNHGDFKKALSEIKTKYNDIRIYRDYFVNRMSITSLGEKNIEDIVDPVIRQSLKDFQLKHPEEKFDEIIQKFSEETRIKKIRCKTFVQKPIEIEAKGPHQSATKRYLNPEDYFAAVIWEIPPAKQGASPKYEAVYLRRTDVDKKGNSKQENKPHPAARKICQLHKQDSIEFSESGIWKKARIAGFSATQNKLDIRPIYATANVSDWIIATSENMLDKKTGNNEHWKEQPGHYFVSVNVLFGSLSARQITVSPIGEVHRKK